MRRLISTYYLCLSAVLAAARPAAAQQAAPPKREMVRVFLDCDRCDEDYLKKEVTFIDYVRNREDSDVHVLVTTQETGGGGTQWTLKFIGLGPNLGSDQTLTYNSPQTATSDEVRSGFAEVFKVGLVRYAAQSSIADRLRVTFKKPEGDRRGRGEEGSLELLDLPRQRRRQLQRRGVVDGAIRARLLFGEPDDGCVAHVARGERQLPRQRVRAGGRRRRSSACPAT